jgi:endonuclease G, mitochondrial
MKKINTAVLMFSVIFVFCAYTAMENENVRFGIPGGRGKILSKHGFVMMYDGAGKTPIWVSYCLKKTNLPPEKVKPGVFKADMALKPYERIKKEDIPVAYDKCPMAPVLDMAYDAGSYQEAFLMSNICAMNPALKRLKWRELEERVRRFVVKTGSVWVVTGPVFVGTSQKQKVVGRAKIALATGFYKALLYQAADGSFHALGFYMDNKKEDKPLSSYEISIDRLEELTGIDFFNALPVEVQSIMEKTSKDIYFFN